MKGRLKNFLVPDVYHVQDWGTRTYQFFWPFFKMIGLNNQWDWIQPMNFKWRERQRKLREETTN